MKPDDFANKWEVFYLNSKKEKIPTEKSLNEFSLNFETLYQSNPVRPKTTTKKNAKFNKNSKFVANIPKRKREEQTNNKKENIDVVNIPLETPKLTPSLPQYSPNKIQKNTQNKEREKEKTRPKSPQKKENQFESRKNGGQIISVYNQQLIEKQQDENQKQESESNNMILSSASMVKITLEMQEEKREKYFNENPIKRAKNLNKKMKKMVEELIKRNKLESPGLPHIYSNEPITAVGRIVSEEEKLNDQSIFLEAFSTLSGDSINTMVRVPLDLSLVKEKYYSLWNGKIVALRGKKKTIY